jgi:ATP-dependent 26S proteasome regulatory subunit
MEAGMFAIRSDHEHVTRDDLLKAIDKFTGELERGVGAGAAGAMFA